MTAAITGFSSAPDSNRAADIESQIKKLQAEQPPVRGLPAVPGERVEQIGQVGAHLRVGGQQPEVLVQPGGLRVVVAGADVRVPPDLVALLPHHERGLAVRLEPDEPVHHMAARLLQLAGPADVGHLVEARLDFHEHHHLLARLGRVDERVDDRGVARGEDRERAAFTLGTAAGTPAIGGLNGHNVASRLQRAPFLEIGQFVGREADCDP